MSPRYSIVIKGGQVARSSIKIRSSTIGYSDGDGDLGDGKTNVL